MSTLQIKNYRHLNSLVVITTMLIINIYNIIKIQLPHEELEKYRKLKPRVYNLTAYYEIFIILMIFLVAFHLLFLTYKKPLLHKNLLFLIRAFLIVRCIFGLIRLLGIVFNFSDELRQKEMILYGTTYFCRYFSDFTEIFFLPTLALERLVATCKVQSYEYIQLRIGLVLFIINLVLSFFLTIVYFTGVDILLFIPSLVNFPALIAIHEYVRRVNVRTKEHEKRDSLHFSLSTRYQIEENLKVIKAGRYIVLIITSEVFVASGLWYYMNVTILSSPAMAMSLFINLIRSYSLLALLAIVFSFEEYRKYTCKLLRIPVCTRRAVVEDTEVVGRVYSDQLASSWDTAYSNRIKGYQVKGKQTTYVIGQ